MRTKKRTVEDSYREHLRIGRGQMGTVGSARGPLRTVRGQLRTAIENT